MPTVLIVGPYRLFFFASDNTEPPHVHVEREECVAKFWLSPVRQARSGGFSKPEMEKLYGIVARREALLREKWNEYFNT